MTNSLNSLNSHTNTYKLEIIKDKYLTEIKLICFMFLENKKNIKHINDEKILECYEFILKEYEIISELKEDLKVKTYYAPYEEIYSNLDELIDKQNMLSKSDKMSFIELTKDINYLEDILSFCFGVLSLIIKDRNKE